MVVDMTTWARKQDLTDAHLTILAIEPAAGGRQPGGSGAAGRQELRGFPFSTIPLISAQRREPGAAPPQRKEHDSARDA